jgi:hypothetical protein|tara:strand:- start:3951 stop:5573 length:1623 start_codon:yes stop_codon:yes gene_type:complete
MPLFEVDDDVKLGLGILGAGLGFFGGRNSSDPAAASDQTTLGYQGEVPDYSLVREQVLDTSDPLMRPGARGKRYFSDARFVPTGDAGIPSLRQDLFDQANVGPDSLRAQNYARQGLIAPDLPEDSGPSGIDSVLGMPLDYSSRGLPGLTQGATYTMEDVTDPNRMQYYRDGTVYIPGYGFINAYDPASLAAYTSGALQEAEVVSSEQEGTEEESSEGGETDSEAEAGTPPAGEGTPPAGEENEFGPADAYGNVADSESPFNFTDAPTDQTTYENRAEIRNIAINDGSGLRRIAVPFGRLTDNQREQLIRLSVEEPNLDVRAKQTYELLKGYFGLKEESTPPPAREENEFGPADAFGNMPNSESPFNFTDAPTDQTTYTNVDEIRNISINDGSGIRRIPVPFGRLTDNQREQLIALARREPDLNVRAREAYELLKGYFGLKNAQAQGGLMSLMGGGYLSGATDGMADKIDASIEGEQPAALSDGEFVVAADVVSHLGNGNSDAGAEILYDMMSNVRKERTGTTRQGKQINPNNYVPQTGIA